MSIFCRMVFSIVLLCLVRAGLALASGSSGSSKVVAPPGTLAAPGYSFSSNAATGIFSPSANQGQLVGNGTEAAGWDGAGDFTAIKLGITTSANLNGVLLFNSTAPTIASGGCTSPAVTFPNGQAAFEITIGTACTGVSTIVLTLPAASHGWTCDAHDITSNATNVVDESAFSTTSVTFTSYSRTTGIALAWAASDVVVGKCVAF